MSTIRLYSPRTSTNLGNGGVDLSPLQQALDGLINVMGRQQEADRQVKYRQITGEAALELKRQSLQLASDGDPATRPERFIQAKDKIREATLKKLDETGVGGGNLFNVEYEENALSEEFQLRKGATAELQKQTEARLEITLDGYARLAGEGTAEQQGQFRDSGMLAISDAVDAGALDPVEGVKRMAKFRSDIVTAQVRRDIYASPHDAEQALLGEGYRDLSPEARIQWLERASSKAEAVERRALAEEERAYRMAERHDKEVAEALQKQGDRFLAEGSMTPEWLEFHRDDLSAGDYRYFYEALTRKAEKDAEGPKIKTDPHAYSDLMGFAMDGQDVRTPAREAYLDQQITREDYDRIISRVESLANSGGRKPAWQSHGEEYLKAYFPKAEWGGDNHATELQAEVLDQWFDWSSTHQDATPEEVVKQRDAIVKAYGGRQRQQELELLPAPDDLVGTRDKPEIIATQQALLARFSAKHFGNQQAILNDPEFQQQAELLETWQRLAPPEQNTPAETKP